MSKDPCKATIENSSDYGQVLVDLSTVKIIMYSLIVIAVPCAVIPQVKLYPTVKITLISCSTYGFSRRELMKALVCPR